MKGARQKRQPHENVSKVIRRRGIALIKRKKCILPSGRLTYRYFEYVNTLIGNLLSQDNENQTKTSLQYTAIMTR